MRLHRPRGGWMAVFEHAAGMSRAVWYEPTRTAEFQATLSISGGERLFRCAFTARISHDDDARDWLVKALLNEELPSVSKLLQELTEDILRDHLAACTTEEVKAHPVKPGWVRLLASLKSECARHGVDIVGKIALEPVAHQRERQIIFEFNDFTALPEGSSLRLELPVTVTLDAARIDDDDPERAAAWYRNQFPVEGEGSIKETVHEELQLLINNNYSTYDLRNDAGRVAEEVQAKLNDTIGRRLGLNTVVTVAPRAVGSDPLQYADRVTVDVPLPGSGRDSARFEIGFDLWASDEGRSNEAFEKDRQNGARKRDAGETLTQPESAAQQGDTKTWAVGVVTDFSKTALIETITKMKIGEIATIGAIPEGDSVKLDAKVNERLKSLLSMVGISANVKVHPVTDHRLHALKNGITVTVPKQGYPLSITTAERQLAFQFQVKLDETSNMRLLTPYFDEAPRANEEFALLRADIADRTINIAAMELGKLTPEEYLDQSDIDDAIAGKIQKPLQGTLSREFGLKLSGKLIMTGEPDAVQVRWREIRGQRRFKMSFTARKEFDNEIVPLRLTLTYEIDRLANPASSSTTEERASLDEWERFRNMALDCATSQEHVDRFERIVEDSISSRLGQFYAEAFTVKNLSDLAPAIAGFFIEAGRAFGFDVRVVHSTVDVRPEDGIPVEPTAAIGNLEVRLQKLRDQQLQDELRRDELEFSTAPGLDAPVNPFDDESSPNNTDSQATVLDERIKRRGERIQELEAEMRTARATAERPMIEGDTSGAAHGK